jgi:hypothetical protein
VTLSFDCADDRRECYSHWRGVECGKSVGGHWFERLRSLRLAVSKRSTRRKRQLSATVTIRTYPPISRPIVWGAEWPAAPGQGSAKGRTTRWLHTQGRAGCETRAQSLGERSTKCDSEEGERPLQAPRRIRSAGSVSSTARSTSDDSWRARPHGPVVAELNHAAVTPATSARHPYGWRIVGNHSRPRRQRSARRAARRGHWARAARS